jgi:KDO2-lipid IV(A) lauroyltransferase
MNDPLLANPPVHTLRSRLQDAAYYALYHTMRYAPIDLVSDLGSAFVRWSVPRNRPWIIEGARANLTRRWPQAEPAVIDAAIHGFLDNVGRMMAEFAVLPRLHGASRITVTEQFERGAATVKEAPTVAILLHTGNWEVCAAALHARGLSVADFAIPPETWAQRVIATKVRKQLGIKMLSPDARGLLEACRELQNGGAVSIFCDEARDGVSMAPLFGRPPHRKGNLATAAWLARKAKCRLVVVNCRRLHKSRFLIDATDYFDLPPHSDTAIATKVLDDVAYLNTIIEPVILANLDQWYFLDNPTE